MDVATVVGIVVALVAVLGSMIMEGGSPTALILPAPMILVFIGTAGVAMASGLLRDFTGAVAALKQALAAKPRDSQESIRVVVEFADRARRDGLLALEEAMKDVDDPFLRKGLELAVDGTDPEEVREILEAEIRSRRAGDKAHSKVFADMGGYAPTLGIVGTVIGLVHVLENLSEPDKLGPLIAGAFVATLWGVMSANLFWLPISKKLARLSELEVHHMELLLEGVLAIQAGANPRIVQQKLLSFVSPKQRAAAEATSETRAA